MADLLLGLGAAVVKAACMVWLKDSTFAASASTEVVDVVRQKISGDLNRRSARRVFEDLEVPVAAKLQVLRQHEFAGMADNEWTAAVLAVGDTLRSATFTDADIFAGDLDPLYLRRHILAGARGATRDLSAAGTALYHRLLTECCAYVVELTSTLPGFTAGAFAEILRRDSLIVRQFAEVLDRMPGPETVRAGAAQAEADFAAAYRRQVVNRLDRLELFGVTVSESVRGYPLSTAYLSLAVSSDTLRDDAGFARPDAGRADQAGTGTVRVDDALADTHKLFLRGEAGSGKTTMLQWLAVRAARGDFPERLAAWNGTMPFLIRLRRYVGKDLPSPEGFLSEIGRHIAADMPEGWVHRLLRDGRALILVDGVDELPASQRRLVRDWLAELVGTFPEARYVVTSRPGAAAGEWLDGQGFDAAEVQPMTWPDVREFVRHWHAAFRSESAREERDAELADCEHKLLDALYARRHLRLLATSPLLCAMTCALNLDRRTQLPDERMELYSIALDMLLERRDIERQIGEAGPRLSKTSKMLLLEDLAYRLIRNGWSDAPKDRVAEWITHRLASMPKADADGGLAVLSGLIERSGLIREPVAGRIDFVHRTFQEYLAAHAAVNDDQTGELLRNAHDDQWREVVIMAAGHAQPRQRDELLRGMLARAGKEQRNRQVLQTLTVACLETSPQLDQALHATIQAVAESLLPPRSLRQAEILSRIGEPLLDLLAGRPPRGARQSAATVRAASLVGGDAALKIIALCAGAGGRSVRTELLRAWPLFNPEEYARLVLAPSPHGQFLIIHDPSLLPGLRHIPRLESLSVSFRGGHGNLEIIRDLPAVTLLNVLTDLELRDLGPLTGHPALERVLLQEVGTIDLRPLATLPKLRYLYFRADRVANVESLHDCAKLDEIHVSALPDIAQLPQLLPSHPIKKFDLVDGEIVDLTPLFGVPQLAEVENLELSSCDQLGSIRGIENWAATLRSFALWRSCAVTDLEPLTGLPQLEYLSLTWGAATNLNIVRRLPALRYLYLYDDAAADLTPLHGMTSLTIQVRRSQQVLGAELLGEGSRVIRI
jgi:NACHT domain